jgi:hypothetical protein
LDRELLKTNDALFFARIVSRVEIVVASACRFGIDIGAAALPPFAGIGTIAIALGLLRSAAYVNIVLAIVHTPLHRFLALEHLVFGGWTKEEFSCPNNRKNNEYDSQTIY